MKLEELTDSELLIKIARYKARAEHYSSVYSESKKINDTAMLAILDQRITEVNIKLTQATIEAVNRKTVSL